MQWYKDCCLFKSGVNLFQSWLFLVFFFFFSFFFLFPFVQCMHMKMFTFKSLWHQRKFYFSPCITADNDFCYNLNISHRLWMSESWYLLVSWSTPTILILSWLPNVFSIMNVLHISTFFFDFLYFFYFFLLLVHSMNCLMLYFRTEAVIIFNIHFSLFLITLSIFVPFPIQCFYCPTKSLPFFTLWCCWSSSQLQTDFCSVATLPICRNGSKPISIRSFLHSNPPFWILFIFLKLPPSKASHMFSSSHIGLLWWGIKFSHSVTNLTWQNCW